MIEAFFGLLHEIYFLIPLKHCVTCIDSTHGGISKEELRDFREKWFAEHDRLVKELGK